MAEVKELLEGRGIEPYEEDHPSVFNIVLERLMEERGIDTYDDLYAMFTEAGYELDFETFYADCEAESGVIRDEFVRGMVDVLELGEDQRTAFGLAIMLGRASRA
jgi:hypothetical protein